MILITAIRRGHKENKPARSSPNTNGKYLILPKLALLYTRANAVCQEYFEFKLLDEHLLQNNGDDKQ